ncbi:EpsG family protein [Butyribacter sp.]|uniref:EpsG family protein n=1 Tax=Butyribacter sp. TaxID=2822465 RepID=UPI002A994337|nr:EpsG family protein [Butyribacter sp.]
MSGILTFVFYSLIIFLSSYILKRKIKSNYYIVLVAAVCATIMMCKGSIGTDTNMYISVYENGIDSLHRWVEFEWGFQALLIAFRSIGLPYQAFFFTISFITMIFIFLAIKNERDNVNVFISTFLIMVDFYFLSWNIIRQTLAMAVAIYAMCIYLDGKYKKGIFFIIVASLFHTSAIVCLAVLVCKYIFENKKYKWFLLVSVIIAIFLISNRDILGKIVFLITKKDYYASYFTRDAETDGNLFTFYLKCFPILLISILGMRNYNKATKYKTLFSFMILGYIFSSIGAITATQVQRVGYYFTYLDTLIIGLCCNNKLRIKKGLCLSKNNLILIVVVFKLLLFWFDRFYKGYANLVPYPWFANF